MFTGIVETIGEVARIAPRRGVTRVTVRSPGVSAGTRLGDSICVQGVCLTTVACDGEQFEVEAIPETLKLTSLGDLAEGDGVNLERALTADTRMGGHFVSGHVDGVGVRLDGPPEGFAALPRGDEEVIHWYSAPAGLTPYLVPKGSVAVQGVSLTVVEVSGGAVPAFSVALIPNTLDVTTLGTLPVGGRVNLEADMIAKYVSEQLRPWIERLESRVGTAESSDEGADV